MNMSFQKQVKTLVGCSVVFLISILWITYVVTSSLNPFTVFASKNVFAKIIVALLILLIGSGILQLLTSSLMRWSVGRTAHRPAEDVICPGCGLPLIQFVGSHGTPIPCPKCRILWHDGPACYRKDLQQKMTMFPMPPCPKCRATASYDEDLFSEENELI